MRTLPATLLCFAAIAAPAAAQGTATATPNTVKTGTSLHIELDATQPPVSGRLPTQTVLSVEKGFKLDTKAVAKRCTKAQADEDACPARSRVGNATVVATYAGSDYTIPIRLYLAKPRQAGDLAGFAAVATIFGSDTAVMGRVVKATTDPYGMSVILPTPGGDLSSFPISFKSFSADMGATRVVKKRKHRKRHWLIRTPSACTGTWASNAVFTFGDGSTAEVLAPIACTS
jgi:hypothetical protein